MPATPHTIGSTGDYTDPVTWANDFNSMSTTGWQGKCQKQAFTLSSDWNTQGNTTGPTNQMYFTTDTNASFIDNWTGSTPLRGDTSGTLGAVINITSGSTPRPAQYFNWSKLMVMPTTGQFCYAGNGPPLTFDQCILEYSGGTAAINSGFHGNLSLLTNCLCVDRAGTGHNFLNAVNSNGLVVVNTTFVNEAASLTGDMCDRMDGGETFINNGVFGWTNVFTNTFFGFTAANSITDSTAAWPTSSTGCLTGKSASAQFINAGGVAGSGSDAARDFRVKTGADLIGAGQTDTTDIPGSNDIINTGRGVSNWTVGCWQYVAASTGIPPGLGGALNYDWSNPRGPTHVLRPVRPDGSPTTLTELAPQLMPFRQRDWHNPQIVASRNVAILSQPNSVLVLTTLKGQDTFFGAPGEVMDYDWPLPIGPPFRLSAILSQRLGTIPSLLSPAPFRQNNWPLPPIGPLPVNQTQPLGQNPNFILLNGLKPFKLNDQPNPLLPPPPTQTQPLGSYRALLASTAPPFYQTDWANPRAPQAPTQTQPLGSFFALVVGTPVVPVDQPNPRGPLPVTQTQPLGSFGPLLLPTGVKPFSLSDWPVPPGARQPTQTQPQGTWRNLTPLPPAPFFLCDWPNPPSGPQPRTQTQPFGTPAILTLLAGKDALPFRLADWANPRAPLPAVQTQPLGTFQGVFSAAPPFFLTAWPVPRGPQPAVQTQPLGSFWPLVVGVPFSQSDWPNPRGAQQPVQTQPLGCYPYLVATVPFRALDWPNPRGPLWPTLVPRLGAYSTLFQPAFVQPPFFQTDWPNPRGPEPRTQTQPLGCAHPTVHPNRLIFNALYLATAAPSYLVSAPAAPYLAIYPGEE